MIKLKEISRNGIPESQMSENTKLANRAMKRAARKLTAEYRAKGIPLITADKNGKIIRKPA